jgi:hypothetical protein
MSQCAQALETLYHAGDGLSPRRSYDATRFSMLCPVIQLM